MEKKGLINTELEVKYELMYSGLDLMEELSEVDGLASSFEKKEDLPILEVLVYSWSKSIKSQINIKIYLISSQNLIKTQMNIV
jgi:hypothetical protein